MLRDWCYEAVSMVDVVTFTYFGNVASSLFVAAVTLFDAVSKDINSCSS